MTNHRYPIRVEITDVSGANSDVFISIITEAYDDIVELKVTTRPEPHNASVVSAVVIANATASTAHYAENIIRQDTIDYVHPVLTCTSRVAKVSPCVSAQ